MKLLKIDLDPIKIIQFWTFWIFLLKLHFNLLKWVLQTKIGILQYPLVGVSVVVIVMHMHKMSLTVILLFTFQMITCFFKQTKNIS